MVKNSPSAISSETFRNTMLRPNVLATFRMLSRAGFEGGCVFAATVMAGVIGDAMGCLFAGDALRIISSVIAQP
jgi:hypothetical protein